MLGILKSDYIKYFITKLLLGLIGLYLVALYSNYFNPTEYGKYSLIIGLVNILLAISIGWISSSISRYLDEHKDDMNFFIINILFLWILLSSASLIIMALLFKYAKIINASGFFYYALLAFLLKGFIMVFDKVLLASRRASFYSYLLLTQGLINLFTLYMVNKFFDVGIKSIFISTIVADLFFVVSIIIKYKLFDIDYKRHILSKDFQIKVLNYGWPLMFLWGLNWILNISDRYIIELFRATSEVGIYDINYRISKGLIEIFTVPFSMSFFPIMVSTWNKHGKEKSEQILSKSIELYFSVILPACFGLIAIRKMLFGNMLSIDYLEGNMVIVYVSFSIFLSGLTQILYRLWKLNENTKMILKLTVLTVVTNIVLNFILIPKYGYISAAISTLISYVVAFCLAYVIVRKEFSFHYNRRIYIKVILSSLAMYMVINLISANVEINTKTSLVLLVAVGILLYTLLLKVSGVLSSQIQIIKETLTKD